MTDHEARLLDSADATTRSLLESALRDRAPASGPSRTVASLGLTEVGTPLPDAAALLPNVARGAAAMPGTAAGQAALAVQAAGLFAGTGKWLAIGLVAGSAASAGSFALQRSVESPSAPPSAVPSAAPRPLPVRSALSNSVGPAPGEEVAEERSAKTREAERSATTAPVRPAPPRLEISSGAMAREAAWIDQARAALRRGDTRTAERTLATYTAERHIGVLDREALLLGVELSVKQGDQGRARRLAADFEAKYPNDAHWPRVRELIAKSAK